MKRGTEWSETRLLLPRWHNREFSAIVAAPWHKARFIRCYSLAAASSDCNPFGRSAKSSRNIDSFLLLRKCGHAALNCCAVGCQISALLTEKMYLALLCVSCASSEYDFRRISFLIVCTPCCKKNVMLAEVSGQNQWFSQMSLLCPLKCKPKAYVLLAFRSYHSLVALITGELFVWQANNIQPI